MEEASKQDKARAYADAYIQSYGEAIDKHYEGAKTFIDGLGLGSEYFPLYGHVVGKDTSLAVFFTESEFVLFFLEGTDTDFQIFKDASDDEEFSDDWTMHTPDPIKISRVKEYLELGDARILEQVSIPGTNFLSMTIEGVISNAKSHGSNFGNQRGQKASSSLPGLLEQAGKEQELNSFAERYEKLKSEDISTQERGRLFEILWRDVLESYGWKPKKFRISGEENDFTAIYQGRHILGEVRWYAGPMTGGKMREFLGKLDPRPQTIGLFISQSGFDEGALSVARRAVNSKTVVLFGQEEIEKVLTEKQNPGDLFDDLLRDVFDTILEQRT